MEKTKSAEKEQLSKGRLRFVILGTLLSVLIFLGVQLFLHWAWVDYKPRTKGADTPLSVVEAKSLATGIPVDQVTRTELMKACLDPVVAIYYLVAGFSCAFMICRVIEECSAQKHGNEQ